VRFCGFLGAPLATVYRDVEMIPKDEASQHSDHDKIFLHSYNRRIHFRLACDELPVSIEPMVRLSEDLAIIPHCVRNLCS
jgi:hypothetical protein